MAGGRPDTHERPIEAVEAAALCQMADRGRITGDILDGPSARDNASNPEAAHIEPIQSPPAGRADRLLVLGARVPVTVTGRADTVHSRLASTAMASLMAHRRKTHAAPPV